MELAFLKRLRSGHYDFFGTRVGSSRELAEDGLLCDFLDLLADYRGLVKGKSFHALDSCYFLRLMKHTATIGVVQAS